MMTREDSTDVVEADAIAAAINHQRINFRQRTIILKKNIDQGLKDICSGVLVG